MRKKIRNRKGGNGWRRKIRKTRKKERGKE